MIAVPVAAKPSGNTAPGTDVTVRLLRLPPQVGQGIGVLVLLTLVFVSDLVLSPVTDTPRNWNESSGVMAAARSSFSTTN